MGRNDWRYDRGTTRRNAMTRQFDAIDRIYGTGHPDRPGLRKVTSEGLAIGRLEEHCARENRAAKRGKRSPQADTAGVDPLAWEPPVSAF